VPGADGTAFGQREQGQPEIAHLGTEANGATGAREQFEAKERMKTRNLENLIL
jgi:hypothetical protein